MTSSPLLVFRDKVLRTSVDSFRNPVFGPGALHAETLSTVLARQHVTHADPAVLELRAKASGMEGRVGSLAVEITGERTLRVRHALGSQVPSNQTPCLISIPTPHPAAVWRQRGMDASATTSEMKVEVFQKPFRIVVSDAGGREVTVLGGPETNAFNSWASMGLGFLEDPVTGERAAVESLRLGAGEAVFGGGETFIGLNKVGQTIEMNIYDALGTSTPRSYKNIPLLVTTGGYGVYFNHLSRGHFFVGSLSATDIQACFDDDFLDYFVFLGSPQEILESYTALTGRAPMPPDWSFGFWQSSFHYRSAGEVLEVARQMRANKLPADVIHIDSLWFEKDSFCDLTFDNERFPDPAGFVRELRDLGFHLSLWQLPYIPEGSRLFEEIEAVGGFVKTADGRVHDCGIHFTPEFKGRVGIIDFTHPGAVEIYKGYLNRLLEAGVSVIKTDFGEAAPAGAVYAGDISARQMHNLYPLLYNRTVADAFAKSDGKGMVWARSGCAGSQRFPVHWGGDSSPNFENIWPQLCGGLSLGMSGFTFWSQDVGGFLGDTNDELLVRSLQWSIFNSHVRIHGMGRREICNFSPETVARCRKLLELRSRLLPTLIGEACLSASRGLPLLRPLALEFPSDPNTWNLSWQFLCGRSLLVGPVYRQDGCVRTYLPAGRWISWWDASVVHGPKWIENRWGLDQFPLFVREGAVIVLGSVRQHAGEPENGELEVVINPMTCEQGEWSQPVCVASNQGEFLFRKDGNKLDLYAKDIRQAIRIRSLVPDVEIRTASVPSDPDSESGRRADFEMPSDFQEIPLHRVAQC